VVQPYRWLTFAGFLRHLGDMPDEWRWRFMRKILGMREGFPQDTYDRANRFPNFLMHIGRPWTGARVGADGRAVAETPRGEFAADFLVGGTGVRMDAAARPELAGCAHNIATWADRYAPLSCPRFSWTAICPTGGRHGEVQHERDRQRGCG
jgi:FAD-dependent urate hydroxylase